MKRGRMKWVKENPDKAAAAKRKWVSQNQDKRAAHCILNNAVQSGRITRLPCEVCGSSKRIHGHHEDYAKPLDVVWLCSKHHSELHKQKKEII